MRRLMIPVFCTALVSTFAVTGRAADEDVRISSVGYLPDRAKVVSITAEADGFTINSQADDTVVYEGTLPVEPVQDDLTRVDAYLGDFSPLQTPGIYYVNVPGVGRSDPFPIAEDVYNAPFQTIMLGLYGWRSGIDVSLTHGGATFAHAAGHLNDGLVDFILEETFDGDAGVDGGQGTFELFDAGVAGEIRDGVGGWYDAGDYGKYMVNAAFTVAMLMTAWEDFSETLANIVLEIPEKGDAVPDFLNEVRYELEWMLKMQLNDGRVCDRLTATSYTDMATRPADDGSRRYFSVHTTAATAGFTATMAQASRIYRPYDPAFADRCLDAAMLSYSYLTAHPDPYPENFWSVFRGRSTGTYDTGDSDDRLWAAAEIWATTGSPDAHADFLDRHKKYNSIIITSFDWSDVQNFAFLAYFRDTPFGADRDPELMTAIEEDLIKSANSLLNMAKNSAFGRGHTKYDWGANGILARTCMFTNAAYRVTPDPAYLDICTHQISFLYGRNVYGRSQVTGDGRFPPCYPHDRRSISDNVLRPYPGLLVGGATNPRNWRDESESFDTNEVAINWTSAMAYALAGFISGSAGASSVGYAPIVDDCTQEPPKMASTTGSDVNGPPVIIDDLEDGDLNIIPVDGRSGTWFTYDDGTGGGKTGPTIVSPGAQDSTHAVEVSASGYTQWGGGIGITLAGDQFYDASEYAGVSFWAKADVDIDINVNIPDQHTHESGFKCSRCGDNFYITVPITTQWARYTVSWDDLQQQGFGTPQRARIDTSAIYAIQLQWAANDNLDLQVDDIAFATPTGTVVDTPPPTDSAAMDAGADASIDAGYITPKAKSGGCDCDTVAGSRPQTSLFDLLIALLF